MEVGKEGFIVRRSRMKNLFSPEAGEKVHDYVLISQLFSLAAGLCIRDLLECAFVCVFETHFCPEELMCINALSCFYSILSQSKIRSIHAPKCMHLHTVHFLR